MSLELRPVEPAELHRFQNQVSRTFSGSDVPAARLERLGRRLEYDRSLAVFDGTEIVATAGAYSFPITTVGDRLPAAGVTLVSVRPTHRRQGLLTRMMRRQLDDIRRRGEPIAALWASEAPIYGRFGYGVASYCADLTIPRGLGFRRPQEIAGRVRLIGKEAALATLPELVHAIAPGQPGLIERDLNYWRDRIEDDPIERRSDAGDISIVLSEAGGRPAGFAIYRLRVDWSEGAPKSSAFLSDLLATGPEAYSVLWRYILDLDLIQTVSASNRPAPEPLRHLVTDPRSIAARHRDALWVRLVDVGASLTGRRYAVPGTLRLEVRDEFCPWNQGLHAVEGGPDGSSCKPDRGRPDLILDCSDLASAYLGSNTFTELARAGRVEEHVPGALALADSMFASPIPAWCPFHF